MANTIKHKRASGSNPSASDLVVGELAIRTDTGVVFTKKDDNSVAEIAGGGETNLGVSTTTTAVTVTSDTGNNATISEASGSAAGVMSVAHHNKLDGIEASATADQTAAEILTAIKTVDGSGSGLDADTVDGISSGSFLRSDAADSFSGSLTGSGPIAWSGTLATFDPPGGGAGSDTATDVALALGSGHRIVGYASGYIRTLFEWNSSSDITIGQNGTSLIGGINLLPGSSGVAKVNGNTIWHGGNDGTGSGLDADLLDGQHGSHYLDYNNFSNTPTIPTNNNQLTNGASYVTSSVIDSLNASNLSSGTIPDARFPSTLPAVSGANLTNISATVASGAIYENSQNISANYSITSGKNAMSAGPITVDSGVTVTITSGCTWTVV